MLERPMYTLSTQEIILKKDNLDAERIHIYYEWGHQKVPCHIATIIYDHVKTLFGDEVYSLLYHPEENSGSVRILVKAEEKL
jgi:hypothetical protein